MADSPSQPPGWPHDDAPQPPAAPPDAPSLQPPPASVPAAPYPPPSGYEPPATAPPAAPHPPPSGYQPPAPTPASYPPPSGYEPPTTAPPLAGSYPPQQQYAPPGPPGQPYAAPSQASGGWGSPPPPQKKSHRTLWITLAAIFGVLALGIGSCTVWFVGTVKAPVDASNRFLAAIDAGDYATAAAMTDPGCNEGMSAAALDELFAGTDITYNLNNSSVTNNTATVSGSFSAQNLSFRSIEVSLRKQGDWRVCGFFIN